MGVFYPGSRILEIIGSTPVVRSMPSSLIYVLTLTFSF